MEAFYLFMWTVWAMESTSIQSEAASDNPSPWLASEFKRVTLNYASFLKQCDKEIVQYELFAASIKTLP